MNDPNDVQALKSISNAVDESQLKIILSTQCIKAQAHLVDKLRKQSEQQREVCNFINSGNLKLETEIRIAEQKIKSMITALETIQSANVDLQKELLLSKERKDDIVKRVTTGIKKYEDLWQEAKMKYESIPFIKYYHQTKNETHTIKQNINVLINDSQIVNKTINEKKKKLAELDKSRVLEMVNYLTNERPKTLMLIKQKHERIAEITKEIGAVIKNYNVDVVEHNVNISKQTDSNIHQAKIDKDSELKLIRNGDDSVMVLPKLELCYIDLDGLRNKLDKIKKADSFSITTKEPKIIEHHLNTERSDPHEDYKMILIDDNINNKPKNYSEKKLIHILDDIKINENDTKDILSKVNQNHLRDVKVSEVIFPSALDKQKATNNTNEEKMDETENVELTPSKSFVIGPPTQYLDLTECPQKNNTTTTEENPTQNPVNPNKTNGENAVNESDIQLHSSGASDTSYEKIKDTILKKHKLDLSPQFVYSKKPMTNMDKKSEEVVTSKFFDDKNSENKNEEVEIINSSNVCNKTTLQIKDTKEQVQNKTFESSKIETSFEQKDDRPISGLLFNHGPDGIIQLSNSSINTTGYDGENDFPHYIDSSLLLSPKADLEIQETSTNNVQVLSQEVPNFLSGLRKTGFSFFGSVTNDEVAASNANINTQQNNNFNFNFGGEEKKTRGGLFSMFR